MARRSRSLRALPYAVLAAAAGYLYYVAAGIEFHHRAGTLGPDVWPKALLALLSATCAWQIATVLLSKDGEGAGQGVQQGPTIEPPRGGPDAGAAVSSRPHRWLVLCGMALTAAYVGFIETFGFFLSTAAYLAVFVAMGGYRRWGVVALVSLGGTLALLFVFMRVVYVSLPPGTGPFAQFTYLLMQLMGIR